jgi:hypothetical protein
MGKDYRKTAKREPEKYTVKFQPAAKTPLKSITAFAFFLDPIAWLVVVVCVTLSVIGIMNNVNPVDRSVVRPALSDHETIFTIVAVITVPTEIVLMIAIAAAGPIVGGTASILFLLTAYFLIGKLVSFIGRELYGPMFKKSD